MSKLLLVFCIALLAVSITIACNPPGFPCSLDSDCCQLFRCNPWARRCTKQFVRGPIGGAAPLMDAE